VNASSQGVPVGHSPVGVTDNDEADCVALIRDLPDGADLPPILHVDPNVDIDALGIAGATGVPVWRGVWFPWLNGRTDSQTPGRYLPHTEGLGADLDLPLPTKDADRRIQHTRTALVFVSRRSVRMTAQLIWSGR
jgi:hypothetical protein